MTGTAPAHAMLRRQLGTLDAVLIGLGSILGTGVFVSLALAAGIAGVWMLPAVLLAAAVAACNGLSSAALAAQHPVSGGTYEYGYRWLGPLAGFSAGWLFLLAKSASAATAALGCAGYMLALAGLPQQWRIPLALVLVLLLALLVMRGVRASAWANAAALAITLLALLAFAAAALSGAGGTSPQFALPFSSGRPVDWHALFEASALLFVAYTGYGRIATLGEEVREPRRTIPRAVVVTLCASAAIYALVAAAALTAVGAETFGAFAQSSAAPLEETARLLGQPWLAALVTLGAASAMLSVLLNLLLGLSRVVLAMGRRGDMPPAFARLSAGGDAPPAALWLCTAFVLGLACIGSVKATWTFSAFTVLIYYALTNLAALRLQPAERLHHPLVAWTGLASCIALAAFIEPRVWLAGCGLLALGWLWRWSRHRQAVS